MAAGSPSMHVLLVVVLLLQLHSTLSKHAEYYGNGLNGFNSPVGRHRSDARPGIDAQLSIGAQCGGQGVACDLYSCVDGPFPGASCMTGSSCQRQSRWLYECVADAEGSSQHFVATVGRSASKFRRTVLQASCKQVRKNRCNNVPAQNKRVASVFQLHA